MSESVSQRMNGANADAATIRELRALFDAQQAAMATLLALLVTKTTINQTEANTVIAVGLEK